MYQDGQGRPGESFLQSFLQEIQKPVGALAAKLALEYRLEYEPVPPRGQIVLGAPPTVDQVRSELQSIGARVPDAYRTDPAEALRYLEEFGRFYLPFHSAETSLVKDEWLPGIASRAFINSPLMTGADVWVNPYLSTHLRDLYTDFDLFNLFGDILPNSAVLKDRPDLLNRIVKYHRPAGHFWLEFGFSNLRLRHQLDRRTQTYARVDAIKSMASNGYLYFEGLSLPHIGLYQLAFLFKPEYTRRIYGVEPSDLLMTMMREIYRHFVSQIKMAERRGEQRIRFGPELSEFNRDLA